MVKKVIKYETKMSHWAIYGTDLTLYNTEKIWDIR